jgi:site-specific DNA recombinase
VPSAEAAEVMSASLLELLGDSVWLEKVWDAGSDHSAELAEINATLADLPNQLGVGVYRAGSPQRAVLDRRIEELAARQEVLKSQTIKLAGWTWQSTGELFADWWNRQDTESRNLSEDDGCSSDLREHRGLSALAYRVRIHGTVRRTPSLR